MCDVSKGKSPTKVVSRPVRTGTGQTGKVVMKCKQMQKTRCVHPPQSTCRSHQTNATHTFARPPHVLTSCLTTINHPSFLRGDAFPNFSPFPHRLPCNLIRLCSPQYRMRRSPFLPYIIYISMIQVLLSRMLLPTLRLPCFMPANYPFHWITEVILLI